MNEQYPSFDDELQQYLDEYCSGDDYDDSDDVSSALDAEGAQRTPPSDDVLSVAQPGEGVPTEVALFLDSLADAKLESNAAIEKEPEKGAEAPGATGLPVVPALSKTEAYTIERIDALYNSLASAAGGLTIVPIGYDPSERTSQPWFACRGELAFNGQREDEVDVDLSAPITSIEDKPRGDLNWSLALGLGWPLLMTATPNLDKLHEDFSASLLYQGSMYPLKCRIDEKLDDGYRIIETWGCPKCQGVDDTVLACCVHPPYNILPSTGAYGGVTHVHSAHCDVSRAEGVPAWLKLAIVKPSEIIERESKLSIQEALRRWGCEAIDTKPWKLKVPDFPYGSTEGPMYAVFMPEEAARWRKRSNANQTRSRYSRLVHHPYVERAHDQQGDPYETPPKVPEARAAFVASWCGREDERGKRRVMNPFPVSPLPAFAVGVTSMLQSGNVWGYMMVRGHARPVELYVSTVAMRDPDSTLITVRCVRCPNCFSVGPAADRPGAGCVCPWSRFVHAIGLAGGGAPARYCYDIFTYIELPECLRLRLSALDQGIPLDLEMLTWYIKTNQHYENVSRDIVLEVKLLYPYDRARGFQDPGDLAVIMAYKESRGRAPFQRAEARALHDLQAV
jgi:hypothetical protein